MNDQHFIFNVLSSIVARSEDNEVQEMVLNLADFLRFSFGESRALEPLARELDAVVPYFALQQSLHGKNLVCRIKSSLETRRVPAVPGMLHTLLRNAFHEGLKTSAMPLRIEVSAALEQMPATSGEGSILVIKVANTGRLTEAYTANRDPCLSGLRENLGKIFGGIATMDVSESPPWVKWTIRIPVALADRSFERILNEG